MRTNGSMILLASLDSVYSCDLIFTSFWTGLRQKNPFQVNGL